MALINAYNLTRDPVEELVEGLFPARGAGFVWAPPYTAKSLLINGELGLAVANGTRFFGRETMHGSVAICLGEGLEDAGVRMAARIGREQDDREVQAGKIAAELGEEAAARWLAEQPPYTDDRMFVIDEPFVLPITAANQLSASLTEAIIALQQIPDLRLVILDSFADFFGPYSYSNEASANRGMQGMKAMVRKLDCCVLAISHPDRKGKGDQMIGSGRLFAAADFVVRIVPENTAAADEPQACTVTWQKNKYGSIPPPLRYVTEERRWEEPARDEETGELIPDAPPALVKTATVREQADELGTALPLWLPDSGKPRPVPELVLPSALPPEPGTRRRSPVRRNAAPAFATLPHTCQDGGPCERCRASAEKIAEAKSRLSVVPAEPAPAEPEPVAAEPAAAPADVPIRSENPAIDPAVGLTALKVRCPRCKTAAGAGCLPGDGGYLTVSEDPLVLVHTERINAASASAELAASLKGQENQS